jgi:hypothetical protein
MRNIASFSTCLAFAAVALVATPTPTQAQATKPAARPKVGQIPEVYTTKGSRLTVMVVRYDPRASKQALV